jgi:hypothetical protein
MNPLILIGLDLVVSAVLVLLGMYLVWERLRSHPAGKEEPALEAANETARAEVTAPREVALPEGRDHWAFRDKTEEAVSLKEQGCTTEEIAQRLQIPTREVEMVLAISQMAETETSGTGRTPGMLRPPEAVQPA